MWFVVFYTDSACFSLCRNLHAAGTVGYTTVISYVKTTEYPKNLEIGVLQLQLEIAIKFVLKKFGLELGAPVLGSSLDFVYTLSTLSLLHCS